MLKTPIALMAYVLSVLISRQYANQFWVIGPVFALACFLVNFDKIKSGLALRHFVFFAVSTLVYAAVYFVAEYGWRFKHDWLDMAAGSWTAGVILGSLAMPMLHARIFKTGAAHAHKISLVLIGSWYGVCLLASLADLAGFAGKLDFILVAIALWQGIYLRSLKIN